MSVVVYRVGAITPQEELSHHTATRFHRMDSVKTMLDKRDDSVYASVEPDDMEDLWVWHRESQGLDSCMFRIVVPTEYEDEVRAYDLDAYDDWCQDFDVEELAASYVNSAALVKNIAPGCGSGMEVLLPYQIALESEWYAYDCDDGCVHQAAFETADGMLYGSELLAVVKDGTGRSLFNLHMEPLTADGVSV